MLAAVLSGFALSLAAPWVQRVGRGATGWLIALLPLGLTAYFAGLLDMVRRGEVVRVVYDWLPSLGLRLSFYVDGLSLLFALLITGIGALVMVYAGAYLPTRDLGRFYPLILIFMASMLGLVAADNLIALYVFWELTSISSYLLIGFTHDSPTARAAALQALLVTTGGGLAMLAGIVLLGQVGGSFELSDLLTRGAVIQDHPLYPAILGLMLLGAFTKSAQFPFHFWLPGAMEAPTPVSAYLHSATMVKAGVYLLARLSPILGGHEAWRTSVTTVGLVTMLVGGFLAITQTDLKRTLAYSTVSALGALVMLLGLGTTYAVQAAMTFLLAHALYKGALFMAAGVIDHETGTRDVERLRGLRKAMPLTAGITALAAVSLAGLPPTLSFIGKEMLLEATLREPASLALTPFAVLGGAFFVTVAGIVGVRPFFGEARPTPKPAHEAGVGLLLGPAVLAILALLLGLAPDLIGGWTISAAVSAILGRVETVHLALWHGVNVALALSGLSLLVGWLAYRGWANLRATALRFDPVLARGPQRWYDLALVGLQRLAVLQTRVLQNGQLRYYVLTILGTLVALVGYTLIAHTQLPTRLRLTWNDLRFYEVALAVLILLATLTAVRTSSRLTAIIALGVVGYSVTLIYVLFGAPDLAMTQVLIETLTVVLLVLVVYHLPPFGALSSQAARARDMVIALTAGVLMTLMVLMVMNIPTNQSVARYYAEQSLPLAYGRNIVNVLLVDFRAFDTLGEITVLTLAAAGVYALLRLRPGRDE